MKDHDKLNPAENDIDNGQVLSVEDKISRLTSLLKKEQMVKKNFRTIVEMMPIPILIAEDKTDTIAYVNDAFCEMFGYAKEELLDQPCNFLCPPEFVDQRNSMREMRTEEQKEDPIPKNHFMSVQHKSGKSMIIPGIFYNWRTNGDRFTTLVMIDRRKEFEAM